jgi:hypothetical protein
MIGAKDIEKALMALWKGKTGATPQVVMRQPALMGLEHVIAQTRDQSGVDQPTDDAIANVCRECIARACEHWTERQDGPDIARLLLGVARGSRGATRKVRLQRIEELYDVKVEWLIHTRDGSSPETRAIEVVAAALADSEDEYQKQLNAANQYVGLEHVDFISPSIGADFRCLTYQAELSINGGSCSLSRQLSLVSLRHGARPITFHDGWGSEDTSFSCSFGTSEIVSLGAVDLDAMKTPTLSLDLYEEFRSDEELELRLFTRYDTKHVRWGERCDYSFGFFANPDGLPIPCSLLVMLPDCEKVTSRTTSHKGARRVEDEQDHAYIGEYFQLQMEVPPGLGFSLNWQLTPQESELYVPELYTPEDG